jgi:hypothetical protein
LKETQHYFWVKVPYICMVLQPKSIIFIGKSVFLIWVKAPTWWPGLPTAVDIIFCFWREVTIGEGSIRGSSFKCQLNTFFPSNQPYSILPTDWNLLNRTKANQYHCKKQDTAMMVHISLTIISVLFSSILVTSYNSVSHRSFRRYSTNLQINTQKNNGCSSRIMSLYAEGEGKL